MKTRTKGEMGAAKSLCSPFDQPPIPEGSALHLIFWNLELIACCFSFMLQVPCASPPESLRKNGLTGEGVTNTNTNTLFSSVHHTLGYHFV